MPDFSVGSTVDFKFTSRAFATGAPTTLAGSPAVVAYEDNSTTEITAGITLSVDFDSVTGLNNVRVVATGGNGFEAGKSYALVISSGTVDSVSVVGEVILNFTLERSAAVDDIGGLSIPTAAAVADAVCDEALSGHTTAGTLAKAIADIETDATAILEDTGTTLDGKLDTIDGIVDDILTDTGTTLPALIGSPVADLATDIAAVQTTADAIETDTQDLQTQVGTAGAGLTDLGGMSTGMKAEVNAEADTAIETYHLDHLLAATYDPASKPGASDALLNELVESDSGVSRFTENALEQAPSGSLTAGGIADAVWDEALSGHTTAGSAGKSLADTEADATAILEDTGTTLDGKINTIDGIVDSILVDTGTTLDGKIDALNDLSVADILTTQMTESYAANGTAPTLAQAVFAMHQFLMHKGISSTTVTIKQLDNSTTAFTAALDDDTTPTAISRT